MCRRASDLMASRDGSYTYIISLPLIGFFKIKVEHYLWMAFKAGLDYCLILGPLFWTLGLYPTISVILIQGVTCPFHFISSNFGALNPI
jgi:hypothetical protein